MKFITRDMDYAMRALCVIAHQKEMLCVDDLVKETRITRPFLRKILQILNRHKLIKSYRGRGGGFVLLKKLKDISLLDIIRIFKKDVVLSDHTFKKSKCPKVKECILKKEMDKIENYIISKFDSIKMQALMK